jgi:large subunit ribosomal protein L23
VFKVARDSNKAQIREAVEKLFNVKVVSINTMIVKGKKKRMGRYAGYRSNWKKAIVRLAEGQAIEKLGEV